MSDIVKRLRRAHEHDGLRLPSEAADRIEQLEREIASARSQARKEALERVIDLIKDYGEDAQPDSEYRLACNDLIEALSQTDALADEKEG